MKRFSLTLAFALLIAMPSFAERVTSETARKVATTFLNNNGAKAAQLTDLSQTVGFQNLYIFTTESSFVVMAADDCVQPILGYSLEGNFATNNMPNHVRGWLQGYNDEIQYAIDSQMRATKETAKLWKDLTEGKPNVAKAISAVEPLIQTKWNQNRYYNNLCPTVSDGPDGHAYTGCVATAMAQIMKYWGYPSKGIGSHSYTWNNQTLSADFNSTTYDWDNMQLYYDYYYADGSASNPIWLNPPTSEQLTAIATLMYHCGVSVDMDYGGNSTGGSAAFSSDVANALITYFNYSSEIEYKEKDDFDNNVWIGMVKAELDANRPLHYSGRGSGGHAFVCDGYNNSNYFHFNWGWSGAYDGYFSLSNLNTGANNQSGQGNGIYTNDQSAIFGIQPVQCAASEPTNLTYTLSGIQNLTLNWTAADGAVSYNIYRNNNCIGNSTTNSYSEAAPFGTNVYYVRSVDANGKLSLSSNSVTVSVSYQTPVVDDLEGTLSGNNVTLSWTAPAWCYPEYPSVTMNYGIGNVYYSWDPTYYAHRHLASSLAQYAGKAVYKVSTFIQYPGTYSLYIYTKSNSYNRPDPGYLAVNINQVNISFFNTWYEFELSAPVILTGTDDLWVVIKQENTGQQYPVPSFNLNTHNTNAFYAGSSSTYLYDCSSGYNCAWLINTYLTDGIYTYNLYRNNDMVAGNLSNTTYTTQLLSNSPNLYTVKTNYYGGLTEASNKVGFAKGNASLATLALDAADKMTVTENSKLTVNGALSSSNTTNLILENGSQLIHGSSNVQATVKKDIAAYTNSNSNWSLIASPVTENYSPTTENGLLNGSYDLYYYDEPTHYWMNYRYATFDLAHQQGYLYANSANTTLQFAGTLTPSNSSVTLSSLNHSATVLNGFNLVGNPFACNATVDKSFYVTNETGSNIVLASSGQQIKPCEGIFVQATNSNTSVTFTKVGAKSRSLSGSFDLTLTQGRTILDRARVLLDSEESLDKFSLNNNISSQIYFPLNGRNFAVTSISKENELPLNFKAAKNGTYTLGIEPNNLDLDYLHLIDNMTDANIDLLETTSYTFEAKTSDYPSRFRLVFSNWEDAVGNNGNFAYVSNGEIIVTDANDDAILQVVDMLGHVILTHKVAPNSSLSTPNFPGVYMLRLITAEGVKTQKMIIE